MKAVASLLLTLSITGALTVAVSAQPPVPPTPPPVAGPFGAFALTGEPAMWQLQVSLQGQASELARQYLKADKESDKREIRQKLTDVLSKMFDEHMRQQQKELEDLEKQIADLRALMKKRANAKDTIVDRRIEQLIQDADGLGWNASGGPHAVHIPGFDFHRFANPKALSDKKSDDSRR